MAFYNLGTLSSIPVSRNQFTVTSFDQTDVFRFNVFGFRRIGLFLHNLTADADLRLYRDSNNNGILDTRDRLVAASTRGGRLTDTINFATTTGRYFAQVRRFTPVRSIRYDLDLSAVYDVGALGGFPIQRNLFSLSAGAPADTFRFQISTARNINLNLHNISFRDNINLRLFRDGNRNGVFDASDLPIATSASIGNRDDSINYFAPAGTYFAQAVRAARGSIGNATYNLDFSAPAGRTASNLLPQEVSVGALTSDRLLAGGVGNTDTTDTYAFSLGLFRGVNIQLSGLIADADIRLIQDRNNNRIVDPGEVLRISSNGGRLIDRINRIEQSGNYYLQVYQFSGNTPYRLAFDLYATPYA